MKADSSGQMNLTKNPAEDGDPAWSPDGSKIAFCTDRDGNGEIYVMDADGSGQVNLTNHPAEEEGPAWSPDGSRIAFATERDGPQEVYVMNADGSGQVNLSNNPGIDQAPDWQRVPCSGFHSTSSSAVTTGAFRRVSIWMSAMR